MSASDGARRCECRLRPWRVAVDRMACASGAQQALEEIKSALYVHAHDRVIHSSLYSSHTSTFLDHCWLVTRGNLAYARDCSHKSWSCCATCNKSRSSSTPRPRSRPRRPVALSTLFVTLAVLHTSRLLFLLVRASPERVLQEGVNFNMRFYAPHGLGWYSNATVQCERGVQPRARPSHKTSASPALAAMRLLGAGLSGLYHGRPPSSSSVCRGLQAFDLGDLGGALG